MGYNLKKLTEELKVKELADDGLVAWGQNSSGAMFGAVGAALAGMHTISCKGDKIVIIPFSNKEIRFDDGLMIDKKEIRRAKVSGLLTAKLKIETVDGKSNSYSITQGKTAVKQILAKLGF